MKTAVRIGLNYTGIFLLSAAAVFAQNALPVQNTVPQSNTGIDWGGLLGQSFEFLAIEHGVRYATEPGTRHTHNSFFKGYVSSLESLHGWADGDPLLINYVGHPLQGAASGFIWAQNDRAYRNVEFGKDRRYWKSRLRAAAFALVYSEQFEVGLVSEASIGNIQKNYPQFGFVDQVVTPSFGLAWMIAEDSIDRFVIRRIEDSTNSRAISVLARGVLNPARSMSNMVAGHAPWYRERIPEHGSSEQREYPLIPRAEFMVTSRDLVQFGRDSRGNCIGGGGAVTFRLTDHWQLVGDVSGCRLTDFEAHQSGDSLTYLIGARWDARPESRWQPFVQVLAGGRTLTHETVDEARKKALEALHRPLTFTEQASYHDLKENSGAALSAGFGLDLRLRSALAFRVAQVDYLHSTHARLEGIDYSNAFSFTSALVLRLGTW